ncbi:MULTISPECIES: NUDIX hydrolase [unclassified Gilliamella]|uniref:NUDIX hydrolase n=1 Tax=unclassified Gilliamella TaxID=2685620 RepID=UPI0013297E59|nr:MULTISPECIES: CoA pyrophosphatase [unclassified Gilliamella]MWN31614.1 NUDIX domain-containing protein [Gilliamella sp. Pra-s60]MWP28721.1 NUDIX domain-containing protein [Gilliamella sp. Pra-s54]MWP46019.1 NUDIX domain-containing protein [Gilliamella sp. Pas-s27]
MITIERITKQIQKCTTIKRVDNKAAVLLPIVHVDDQLQLLFQVRSKKLKRQPGDICFPGGRVELADINPEYTAKRETVEELGLPLNQIKILGQLPKFIATLGMMIYPFVGTINSLDDLQLNHDEVEQIFTVPIAWFIDNPPQRATMFIGHKPADDFPFDIIVNRSANWQKRSEHSVYFYQYQDWVIWGLTAQLINLFIENICE